MRVPTKNSKASLWAEIPLVPLYAIEKATGLVFNRKFAPPQGLWTAARDLSELAHRVWPDQGKAWETSELALLYLEMQTAALTNVKPEQLHGPTNA